MIAKDYVTVKGTRNGLLVSMREECAFAEGLDHLRAALTQGGSLVGGAPISLDLGWREVTEDEQAMLAAMLAECGIDLLGIISTSLATRRLFEGHGIKVIIGSLGLARHGGRARARGGPAVEQPAAATEPADAPAPVEKAPDVAAAAAQALAAGSEPTMLVRKTLRSGQRVKFAGNVVVVGDVNAGAEIEAGGDVIVLGNVRGTVHAGAGGKTDAMVLALNLYAPQVRIGDRIGFIQGHKTHHNNAAVMARMHDGEVHTTLYGN